MAPPRHPLADRVAADTESDTEPRIVAPAQLHVRVLLFASYADAVGATDIPLVLVAPATAGDALAHIRARAGARQLPPRPLLAVNERYAAAEQPLADGDVVAVIPPVAGG